MTGAQHSDYQYMLEVAHRLADSSAVAILPYFRSDLSVVNKAADNAFDPVTAADRAGEQVMRKLLGAELADHDVLGEELGTTESGSALSMGSRPD